jgi:hypothetical protein
VLSGHPEPTQALSLAVPEAAANSLFRNILPVSPSASIFCLQRGTFPSTNLNKIMDFPYVHEKYYAYICRPTPCLIFCPNGTADTLLLIT